MGSTGQDQRILILTKHEESKLLERIAKIQSLADLRHIQKKLFEQLGIRVHVQIDAEEIRTVKGLNIFVEEQLGLCAKTRKTIPKAIRQNLRDNPQTVYDLLDEQGLFGLPH